MAAACPKCATEIVEGARFCFQCGTPVLIEIPINTLPEDAPSTVADPFSHTAPADPAELARVREKIAAGEDEPTNILVRERPRFGMTKPLVATEDERKKAVPKDRPSSRESTLESAAVSDPRAEPRAPAPVSVEPARSSPSPVSPRAATSEHASRPSVVKSPHAVTAPPPRTPAGAPAAPAVGANVKVLWSDGNAYPGSVMQVAPQHCLVRFPNGHTQWVEYRYIVPA